MEFRKLVNIKSKMGALETEYWMCLYDERLWARQNFRINTRENRGTQTVWDGNVWEVHYNDWIVDCWEHKEIEGIMWNTDKRRKWEPSTHGNSSENLNNNLVIISTRNLHLQQANCTITGVLSCVKLFETTVKCRFNECRSNEIFSKTNFLSGPHQFTTYLYVKIFHFNKYHCNKNISLTQ
jgi:hypothetical protein